MKERMYFPIVDMDEIKGFDVPRGGMELHRTVYIKTEIGIKDVRIGLNSKILSDVLHLKIGDKIPCIRKKALIGSSYYYEPEYNLKKYPIQRENI